MSLEEELAVIKEEVHRLICLLETFIDTILIM